MMAECFYQTQIFLGRLSGRLAGESIERTWKLPRRLGHCMAKSSKPSLTDLTGEAILSGAFERLRPRLLAMVERRIGRKLAARIDPEGVVQEAYLRARPRWQALNPKPADLDAWVYGQVHDRLIELVRGALGPQRDAARDVPCPDGSAAPLAEHLVDSQTGPATALSRAERCAAVQAALEKLSPTDREIVALRHFDNLSFVQIGSILGLSRNAATKRGLRAMVELRDLIPPAFRPPGASKP
jgi:RNA polymerase sigma-70 factor (ECF subfamily)